MANSKAQSAPAPANGRGSANDKTNGAIKVVMPDANGDFTAPVAKSAIEKVQVVDVDMVLQLKDGTTMVLAGGAISAMDAGHTEVKFSDGLQGLSNLLDLVGVISIPKLDPILSSLQGQGQGQVQGDGVNTPNSPDASGLTASVTSQIVNQLTQIVQVNSQSATIKTVDPTAQTAVLSQNTKTGDVNAQPLQHIEPPIPPEKPGVLPQEHIIGPDAPAMALSLVNLVTITQIGNVLYGSGGAPASAIDSTNSAQFAPQVIDAPADATEIHAISNIPPNNFIKVIDMTLTGNGIAQSIIIKGVPAGMMIANGTDMGGGVWSIPVMPGQRDYGIQLEYTTQLADPSAPVHQQFSLEFDVTMSTGDGTVELAQVKQFVVKDVNSASDLSYIDSTTGESVYVLPAQGNAHIIHAGDGGVTIYGSNAADFLFGGAGADIIHGGSGNSYFEGGAGADQLIGGVGVNTAGYTLSANGVTVDLVNGVGTGGDAQGDTLTNIQNVIGSTHDDVIVSGTGANNINGGGGVDTISYAGSGAAVIVDLGAGTGIGGNAAGDVLTGIQNVIGSAHNDTFLASSAANAFVGGGHDVNGVDTVSYATDTSGTGVVVDLFNGSHTGGAAAGDTYSNIQNIVGTAFNDTFYDGDSAGANRYDGGIGGQDTVDYSHSGAAVTISFQNGRGSGGSADGDSFVNIQNVVGSNFDDVFTAGSDSKSFDGGTGGFDTVSYTGAASGVIIDTAAGVGRGAAAGNTYTSIEKFIGSGSDDIFIGSAAHNWFDGGGIAAGSDTVDYSGSTAVIVDLFHVDGSGNSGGFADGDILTNIANVIGGAGDDKFIANAAQNSFDGGGGNNTVSYEHSTSSSGVGVTVDLSSTNGSGTGGNFALGDKYTNIQNVIGSTFDDTFVASAAANIFTGFGGSDTVSYINSTSTDATGVTVNLSTGLGSGDFAEGDVYIGVQNVTGSAYNDTFIASDVANVFISGGGSDTVSYHQSADSVKVDLVNGVGSGGDAEGDKFVGIQNVIGSELDDIFIDSLAANVIEGGGTSLHNRVSYANSVSAPGVAAGVIVDLTHTDGTGTSGGYAAGDKLSNIQDLTGSAADDTFFASLAENNLDGGASTASSHNRVSYLDTATRVVVDLVAGAGTGGYAQGDTYTNIQDVTGSLDNDTIVDSAAANYIDGGLGALHNSVSYANSVTSAGAAAGVTVDLNDANGVGTSGGYATGDHLVNIQDLLGSSADDTFVASAAANFLDGGVSDANSHNRVSYLASNDGATVPTAVGVTVDLVGGAGTGGYAQGDTYARIQDVTGSNADDLIIASLASNHLDGAGGVDTVSYLLANNNIGVTVNLATGQGSGAGSFAENDTYASIENVVGSLYNDTFYASLDHNKFTGSGGVDTVNYSFAPNDGNGVTVNLVTGDGTGGFAEGDKYDGIQNVTGTINNDKFYGNIDHNAFNGGAGGVDTVDYSTIGGGAVTVDFSPTGGPGTGTGGLADGDTYVGIRNVVGSEFDDTFTANADVNAATSNSFFGGTSDINSHNRVSYAGTNTAVTVNLATGQGTVGAIGDRYTDIQDVTGTLLDDTVFASLASNKIDGGLGTVHNRVDYSASVDTLGAAVGVNVDLVTGAGLGGYAEGDLLSNIQDLTGSGAADTFIASDANNNFDGGAGSDTVSYAKTTGNIGVTVDLFAGPGTAAATGGFAANDTFISIENIIGSKNDDTFIDGTGLVSNTYTGLAGSNTVDYNHSTGAVTVNLFTGLGQGGFAEGDIYAGIQNVKGSAQNDTFIDGSGVVSDTYTGNGGIDTVSYEHSNVGVTVDFGDGINGSGSLGYAGGDIYVGIRNVLGSLSDDIFFAGSDTSLATANRFDGNTGTVHNRVNYSTTTTAVTVDLSTPVGTGGQSAAGDTYVNIQDVTGTSADDTIVASLANNNIDGGTSVTGSHNRVSYAASVDNLGVAVGVNVNLLTGAGLGGYADGDVLSNIQDLTGSNAADNFVASGDSNRFEGLLGNDTVDYSSSGAIIVNLSLLAAGGVNAGTGSGGLADTDTYSNIENIKGSAFNDTFYAGTTANVFTGGGGTDTVSYVSSVNGVNASLLLVGGAPVAGTGGDAEGDTFIGITNLTGSGAADTLTGLAGGGSTLDGGAGADTLTGSGGHNTLLGGGGSDSMTATGGDNFLNGGNGADIMSAGGDNNIFLGGSGNSSGVGDTMTGTGGANNTADYTGSGAGVVVDLTATDGTGTSGGDAAGDKLSGIQNVRGSANDDTFVGNSVANVFTGNGGIDTVSYFHSNTSVIASLATGTGTVGDATGDNYTGITNLTGGSAADTLTGLTGGGSTLTGNAGDDIMSGTSNNLFIGGAGADNMTGSGANNTASYINSTAVVIDLVTGLGSAGAGAPTSEAIGDHLSGIQNLIGGAGDDIFYLNHGVNDVQGGLGMDTVNYSHEGSGVDITIDLSIGTATSSNSTFGGTDTMSSIENAVGGDGNDIFIASSDNNFFDGGAGFDTVSYAKNTAISGNVSGVTVDFHNNTGSGAGTWANGDTYAHMENAIGTAGNDTFVDAGDGVHNSYDGTVNGAGGHDLVSYQYTAANSGDLTIGLDGAAGHNTGNTGSGNVGDTYSHISDLTGAASVNTTIWGDANANILTALGTTNINVLNGGGGDDILDGRLGGHNTLLAGDGGSTIFEINTMLGTDNTAAVPHPTSVISSNIDKIDGSTSSTTLDLHNLSDQLNLISFRGIVKNIHTLDLMDKTDADVGSGGGSTRATISSDDIVALGIHVGTHSELTLAIDPNGDSILLVTPPNQVQVVSNSATSNDYTFYSSIDNHEIAVLHILK